MTQQSLVLAGLVQDLQTIVEGENIKRAKAQALPVEVRALKRGVKSLDPDRKVGDASGF